MIIDLDRFIAVERPAWAELETSLHALESDPNLRMPIERVQRFHELYERASADLAKLATFSAEPETLRYLESLVSRAYGEIHETRKKGRQIFPLQWLRRTLPQTFRRNLRAFQLSVAVTLVGVLFGGLATWVDPESRHVTMPFGHDMMTPSQRVHQEETRAEDPLTGKKPAFSAHLITHNIQVSLFTLALGISWGAGTTALLFFNGIALGAIGLDYIGDGQARFLLGWLLPHGVIEIPAILISGQAGFILAFALIGWGNRVPLGARLRRATPDIVTLAMGVALLLIWAGFVEAFLSQYHEPLVPYSAKIAFGVVEAMLLYFYLARSGGHENESAVR
ncbi:MAG TPA: stage II sporulation protein M [Terriglobia bacterium]|nr:stage II sporulation protein M [Terriglobia bacterium]